MECGCRRLIDFSVQGARRRARSAESDYAARLDSFRGGILEGAKEVAARHLYRAGVYLASLDGGLNRDPSPASVLASLVKRLSNDSILYAFFQNDRVRVEQQRGSVEPQELLRRILRRKNQAPGLLEANAMRELDQARASLELVERIDRYLTSWRESMRMEGRVNLTLVVDMHQ
jgi:hypothetical protein